MPLFIIMKMIAKVTMFVYFLNYRKKKGNVNYLSEIRETNGMSHVFEACDDSLQSEQSN